MLTQRISSGLYIDLHLNVSSNIFFALSTFQFLATRYLFKHASLQYIALRPTKGPNLALSSLTCKIVKILYSILFKPGIEHMIQKNLQDGLDRIKPKQVQNV